MQNSKGCDLDSKTEEHILIPYNYIEHQVPFKVVTDFSKIFNIWFNVSEDKLKQIDEIMKLYCYITALWDDIQDHAALRRGIPTAHSIFGIPCALSAASAAFAILLEKCLAFHPNAIGVFAKFYQLFALGQGIEIHWRDNYECPSEEEYNYMAIQKCSGVFMCIIRLMGLFSENKLDINKLVDDIGLYDHILDDYLNLKSETYNVNSYCDDITQGKFSFPVIHASNTSAEAKSSVMHTLRQRTKDKEVLKACVYLLESCGSFEYTRKKLESLRKEIKEEATKLGLDEFLDQLLSIVPDRATQENIVKVHSNINTNAACKSPIDG